MKPTADTRWSLLSLRALILENDKLRVTVLPELGGRVYSIVYKPRDREILWQNPRVPPRKTPFGALYDDVWCGGWEENFPNDVPGAIAGENYPDHGEVWAVEWDWAVEADADCASLRLWCSAPISGMRLEKRLTLPAGEARLHVSYRLTNEGYAAFPFLFKLHAAFAARPGWRIDLPERTVVEVEPEYPASLAGVQPRFMWPHAPLESGTIDLRWMPPSSERRLYFFYGTESDEGWCAITDPAAHLAAGLVYDPAFFRSCWVFASYGGWRNHEVVVLEPATGHPFRIERAVEQGMVRTLEPGESVETRVTFQVEEELTPTAEPPAQS